MIHRKYNETWMALCARLWSNGHGTGSIAQQLGMREHEIYNRLELIKFCAKVQNSDLALKK